MSTYLILAAVIISILLASIGNSSVSVAFPVIMSSLDTSLIAASWVLSINSLVTAVGMPLAGKASDVLGRKFVFILSMGLFAGGSLLCALAPNIGVLIFARFIQGLGGSGFVPSAVGIGYDAFPKARQQLVGMLSSVFPIGNIIGPNLGGWMTTVFGWRSLFWVNIPFCLFILVAVAFLLRSQPRKESRMDIIGAGLLTGSVAALMVGLSSLGDNSSVAQWAVTGILFGLSLVFIIAFLRREARVSDPVIDPQLLKRRPFAAANLYNFLHGTSVIGVQSLVPLYAVSIYGISILEIGLILTARSVMMVLSSAVASFYLVRWGYRWPLLAGNILMIGSLFLLGAEFQHVTLMGIGVDSRLLLLAIMTLVGLAGGIASPAANNACIELMPERVSTITGLRGTFRMGGSAIAIAVLSVLLQKTGDMARGFLLTYFGVAVLMLITTPVIWAIPKCPKITESDRSDSQPEAS